MQEKFKIIKSMYASKSVTDAFQDQYMEMLLDNNNKKCVILD